MADDGGRIPGCEACQFIGRICLPDCPFAPYFETEWTRTEFMDRRGRTVTECARSFDQLEPRRNFVEGAVEIFSGSFPEEELHGALVEAILSEAEKELEPPPEPALHSSCSSNSSPPITRIESDDDGDDADTHEVKLPGSEKPLEESGTSTGFDQILGFSADQDSIFMPVDRGQLPGCAACQYIRRICQPDCPLAPYFGSGGTHGAHFAALESIWQGRTLIDSARRCPSQKRRRRFLNCAVYVATMGSSAGKDGHRLLVEAILSKAEKELELPPEPAPALGSSSSADPKFSSEAQYHPVAKYLNKLADEVIGTAESAAASSPKGFFEGVSMLEASGSDRHQAHGDQDFDDGLRPSDLDGNIRHGSDDYNDDDSDRVDQKLEVNGDELQPENQGKDSSDTQKQRES